MKLSGLLYNPIKKKYNGIEIFIHKNLIDILRKISNDILINRMANDTPKQNGILTINGERAKKLQNAFNPLKKNPQETIPASGNFKTNEFCIALENNANIAESCVIQGIKKQGITLIIIK